MDLATLVYKKDSLNSQQKIDLFDRRAIASKLQGCSFDPSFATPSLCAVISNGSLREIQYLCVFAPLRSFLPTAPGSLREIHSPRARRPTRLSLRANRMPDACGY